MTQNDDPLPKFPLLIKIIWTLTFLSLLTALILCLIALKKPKVEPPKIEYRQEPFVYGWSSPVNPAYKTYAVVTAYTPYETCKGKCITAAGTEPQEGRTIACPYWIPLHTRVEIDGKIYICEDRTAEWIQKRNGDTFDVFMRDYWEARRWGKRIKEVKIYQ